MKWIKRILGFLLLLALLAYGGITAYVYARQGQIVYQPSRKVSKTPLDFGLTFDEKILEVKRATGEREKITSWWIPSTKPNGMSILFLHGNGGNIGSNLGKITTLVQAGFNVLTVDYRGYGASEGDQPYEAALYEDANAALTEFKRREPDQRRRIIHGHSMGGAIAIELALHRPEAQALIIESTFDSMFGMSTVRAAYKLLPIKLILTERFDSIDKIGQIKLPVLFIHGTTDPVVPSFMSERLYAASGASDKRLLLIDRGLHSNLHSFPQYMPAVLALAKLPQ